ncbi:hypothetical protein BT93_L1613 [Corymbia citriodora subsp. variegata]|uniref:TIR domain-containing protein n=1 Tax=Corymbia citriodora subsp. variegata TaxID=360336 RepID=A0A8T0CM03_CORYI|nr:hypothetical protein BT93_L1613 [Corymbia citriodora subsp. variegata]
MASSTNTLGMGFEAFLSFRGLDTRNNFINCLYIGQKIGGSLLRALTDSQIYIPIFSKGFTSSSWCLREIAHMIDCTSKSGGDKKQILPIFFDVEPDDVKLKTELYIDALSKHKKKYGSHEVKRWGDALVEVSTRVGWKLERKEPYSRTGSQPYFSSGSVRVPGKSNPVAHPYFTIKIISIVTEYSYVKMDSNLLFEKLSPFYGELTKLIVRELLLKLKGKNRPLPDHLVETDDLKCVEKLLDVDSNDHVQFLIIHGVGGIGKSTLASIIFNRFQSKFDCSSFLDDVPCQGLLDMQKKLLSDTLGSASIDEIHDINDGIDCIRRGLSNKKVLVVVDNVDEKRQLDKLAGRCNWFGFGSRIIITIRDKSIMLDKDNQMPLNNYLAYPMMEMPIDRAIQLFSKHAFRSDTPLEGCYNFLKEVVSSIGRLPLTLEVVGSLFANTVRSKWDETLEDLKQVPHRRIRNTLMMSIKKLDDREKAIFLDIACFCIGEDKTYAYYMWHSSGYSPHSAIDVLLLMSLIKIDEFNRFWMHDEIRDLGRYIVKEENFEDPGERRWVRIDENTLDIQSSNKLPETLGNLKSLTKFEIPFHHHIVQLPYSIGELESLIQLDLRASRISILPDSIGRLKNLKHLLLSQCKNLHELPGSIGKLESLVELDLKFSKIFVLPNSIGRLKNLKHLLLFECKNLHELPVSIGELESLVELDLKLSGISTLPDSIGNLKRLKVIKVSFTKIHTIPWALGGVETLEELDASFCPYGSPISTVSRKISGFSSLHTLKIANFSDFQSLSVFSISGCLMPILPNLSCLKRLQELRLHEFPKLKEIPGLGEVESLKFLQISECGVIEKLSNLSKLKNLMHLELLFCKKLRAIEALKELYSLKNVKIIDCMSLKSLPDKSTFTKLSIDWTSCRKAAKLTIQSTV